MNPAVKYTLGRLGLLLAAFALMLPVPVDLMLKLLVALLVSFLASYFLLRRWKEELVDQIDGTMRRRREHRQQLRAALAGEDQAADREPAAVDGPTGAEGASGPEPPGGEVSSAARPAAGRR